MLCFAGFELDQERGRLRGPDGEAIKLRPKSFDMLQLFATNSGRVLSKQDLIEAIWPKIHVGDDSLFQCIREIRTALGDEERQLIKLVSGRGYLFETMVSVQPRGSSVRPELGPAAAPTFASDFNLAQKPPTVAVMPVVGAGNCQQIAGMAASVTDRLTDGLAKIDSIRVLAPRTEVASASPEAVRAGQANFVVSGELRVEDGAWTLQARMSNGATGELKWAGSVSVAIEDADVSLQQIRLAAGVGHPLAIRLNSMVNSGPAANGRELPDGGAKVVIEQAMASINQTTPERFKAAQAMLEKALADEPDDVDLEAALAAHLLRGVQMVWYNPADIPATERDARSMLERALRSKPTYIPVLEGYCRFLTATNQFVESLVACGKVLAFDPWDGLALYHLGLTQVQLGRFDDALATFQQAIRFDTPRVARWTWLLGAGYTSLFMDRDEEAIPLLIKSIAITPGTGRTHALLAAAYQRTGRSDEARAAMAKALELRPGSSAVNIPLPKKNVSAVYQESSDRIVRAMVEAGLPER